MVTVAPPSHKPGSHPPALSGGRYDPPGCGPA
jgi:hypothetical protein